jgi:hypothetical protein
MYRENRLARQGKLPVGGVKSSTAPLRIERSRRRLCLVIEGLEKLWVSQSLLLQRKLSVGGVKSSTAPLGGLNDQGVVCAW